MDYLSMLKKFDKAITTRNLKLSRIYESILKESKDTDEPEDTDASEDDEEIEDEEEIEVSDDSKETPSANESLSDELFKDEIEENQEGDEEDIVEDSEPDEIKGKLVSAQSIFETDDKDAEEIDEAEEPKNNSGRKAISADEFFKESEDDEEEVDEHKAGMHHYDHNLNEEDLDNGKVLSAKEFFADTSVKESDDKKCPDCGKDEKDCECNEEVDEHKAGMHHYDHNLNEEDDVKLVPFDEYMKDYETNENIHEASEKSDEEPEEEPKKEPEAPASEAPADPEVPDSGDPDEDVKESKNEKCPDCGKDKKDCECNDEEYSTEEDTNDTDLGESVKQILQKNKRLFTEKR